MTELSRPPCHPAGTYNFETILGKFVHLWPIKLINCSTRCRWVGQILRPGLLYPQYPQAGGWVAAKPMRTLDKIETSSGNWTNILWSYHLQSSDCHYGIIPELLQLACYCMLVLSFLFLHIRLTTLLHSHVATQYHPRSDIRGSYSAIYEHSSLLQYGAVSLGERLPMSSSPWSS
jgi:hypothetical protein